jgi:hypothetical protein
MEDHRGSLYDRFAIDFVDRADGSLRRAWLEFDRKYLAPSAELV